ncbi:MAG: hypothetical protein K2N58_02055 [Treponemataceae bacterium]|nr:hypothetical protein [Treponemataceae bacterium]
MKKLMFFVAMTLAFATIYAQKKPVIFVSNTTAAQSETNVKGYWGPLYGTEAPEDKIIALRTVKDTKQTEEAPDLLYKAETPASLSDIIPVLQSSLFSELTATGAFEVLAEKQGNAEYIFETIIEDFTATRAEEILTGKIPKLFAPTNKYDMTVATKVSDTKTGEIVFEKQFQQGQVANPGKFVSRILSPKEMAETVAKTIALDFANEICPPTVLSVSDGIIEIPIQGVSVGTVVDVIDEYSLIAEIIVYEMNTDTAKCRVDPKGAYTSAAIKEGMSVKATTKNGKKALKNINKVKK